MLKLILLLITGLTQTGCPDTPAPLVSDFDLPYSLSQPDKTMELELNLSEISGLSLAFGESRLAAINDEQGIVYLLDPETGSQLLQYEFNKPGDYEGIEFIGDHAYVVKSTGTIYEIKNFGTEGVEMIKHNGWLEKDNDVEGLGYDPVKKCLLLACKGKAGNGKAFAASRSVYSFDPASSTFDTVPSLVVRLDDVRQYLEQNKSLQSWERLSEFFSPSAEDLTFAPSAIAIHPKTGNIYMLSSVGKLLLILNPSGQIVHLEKLEKKIHKQPEGICFASDGTMYISNEAKGTMPLIHRFTYQR